MRGLRLHYLDRYLRFGASASIEKNRGRDDTESNRDRSCSSLCERLQRGYLTLRRTSGKLRVRQVSGRLVPCIQFTSPVPALPKKIMTSVSKGRIVSIRTCNDCAEEGSANRKPWNR